MKASSELGWRVPLSDVAVDDELVDAVLGRVRSGWWSMGPRVEEFEREFADVLPGATTPSRSPTAPPRFTSRYWPSAAVPATRSSSLR